MDTNTEFRYAFRVNTRNDRLFSQYVRIFGSNYDYLWQACDLNADMLHVFHRSLHFSGMSCCRCLERPLEASQRFYEAAERMKTKIS